jgi:hypothetical protein
MKIFATLLAAILINIIIYGTFAFIEWDLNPQTWHWGTRLIVIALSVSQSISLINKNIKK